MPIAGQGELVDVVGRDLSLRQPRDAIRRGIQLLFNDTPTRTCPVPCVILYGIVQIFVQILSR